MELDLFLLSTCVRQLVGLVVVRWITVSLGDSCLFISYVVYQIKFRVLLNFWLKVFKVTCVLLEAN